MSAFVGVSKKLLSADELKSLIEKLATKPSYYFLRWANQVSGVIESLKDFPSPEGQIFNEELELRWKQKGAKYEALFLSSVDNKYSDFETLSLVQKWVTEDRNANFYDRIKARFPKEFNYPEKLNIAQRYFKDEKTAIVHFVALTVLENPMEKNHD